jgi:hypothetical protein
VIPVKWSDPIVKAYFALLAIASLLAAVLAGMKWQ